MNITKALAVGLLLCVPAVASAEERADPAKFEKVYGDMFRNAKGDWAKRVERDETQKICSQYRNNLPTAEFEKVVAREKGNVVLPADGKVMGDWKAGEKIAQSGFGLRFNDKPGTVVGGNCYACHQMSKKELSFGTLGPSLVEYGKIRKYDPEEAKRTYARIYNPQTIQPCSIMPRFGHNKVLDEQQMRDLVALLFDPESPVNK
ncbi:MAG: sulfur oxidation c-type cytochrome SoxX [Hyphomicrobiaceae bacterium]